MIDVLTDMMERIVRLEQRLANTAVHGKVHEVDAKKQVARLRLGGTDEDPYLGPWVPYAQQAGALKVHTPVSVGQNMTQFSPTGDPAQGVLLPFTWNNDNKSPSEKGDENVITFGPWKITLDNGVLNVVGPKVKIKGDVEIEGSLDAKGERITHNDKKIDASHKHKGVQPGGGNTDVPV